jgi:hypothetical protein
VIGRHAGRRRKVGGDGTEVVKRINENANGSEGVIEGMIACQRFCGWKGRWGEVARGEEKRRLADDGMPGEKVKQWGKQPDQK